MRIISYQEYRNMRPNEFQPGDIIEAKVVLVVGYGEDYAVYIAPDASWTAEQTAAQGDKIDGYVALETGYERAPNSWAANRAEVTGRGLFRSATVGRWPRR